MSGFELRSARPESVLPLALVVLTMAFLAATVVAGRDAAPAAGLLVLVSLVAVAHRSLVRWEVQVAALIVIVLTIPIKRYEFAVALPFDLEPYRVATAIVIAIWISALLVDPRVRLRRSALDAPLLFYMAVVFASVALNPEAITNFSPITSIVGEDFAGFLFDATLIPYMDVSSNVAKELLFLASFYLTYYFIVSVIRTPAAIHTVLRTLVIGAAAVAVLAIVERRTGFNVFDRLGWIPLIEFEGAQEQLARGGRLRVYASAQHPIALAGLFAVITPVSVYLAYATRRRVWYAASALLVLGGLATVSRTNVVMVGAVLVVFIVLRREIVRPLLILLVPAVLAVHLVVPGAMGSLRQAFFPREGLIADQTVYGGRISERRIGPQLDIIKAQPAFGQGYGTRVTAGENQNARILDNQWLATAVETGIAGVFAWLWLFFRFLRRAGGAARADPTARGWLLTALSGSALAFALGMLTFDAFSFIQITFVMFVLLGLGASALASTDPWPLAVSRARTKPIELG